MNISKIKIGSTTYDIKDATARSMATNATHFKGSFNASNEKIDGGSSTLTSVAEAIGDMYVCDTAGTLYNTKFEVGDSLIFKSAVAAGTAPTSTNIVAIEATVSVSVPSTTPTLSWSNTSTIGTVEGVDLKVTMPSQPTFTELYTGTVTGVTVGSGGTNYTPTNGVVTIPAYPTGFAYSAITYSVNATTSAGGTLSLAGTTPLHVVTLTGNVSALTLSVNPAEGHSCHVIFTAASEQTVAIAHDATSRVCPAAEDLSLTVPAGGYVEIDFLTANSKVYVRGI